MPAFVPRATDPERSARLARELRVHPVTAQILAARGIEDVAAARDFLRPSLSQLHDPMLFRDMDRALDAVVAAIGAEETIAVYGDYDVDGVSGTTILVRMLRTLGARVRPFIPHRVRDGYGLSAERLAALQAEGCGLVVTVDNGTTRAAEIAAAQRDGLRVVVTDHHEPGADFPDCPVLNPKRADSTYPFAGLAGCGVAFQFALAIGRRLGRLDSPPVKEILPDLMALAAIGTVADVVPLRDENRALVALGLQALGATRHAGLRALLEVSRCAGRALRTSDIGFKLGPRINAAGRLDSATLALDLLLCEEPEKAAQLAAELDAGNRERQQIQRRQSEEALERAREQLDLADAPALVLSDPEWHPGVIGIVAARIAETFGKPAALITEEGDFARGSARSHGGVRLHEALESCSALLATHGGHAFAAGFTMETRHIPAFRTAFESAVRAQDRPAPGPREVDAELPIDAITRAFAGEIHSLAPFGMANPEPVFCAYGARCAGKPRLTGVGDRHLVFHAGNDRAAVRAILFNGAGHAPFLDQPFDLSFVVRARTHGPDSLELHVRELVPAGT